MILNTIKFWNKIEHFSPYEPQEINSENFTRTKVIDDSCFPWNTEREYVRCYMVYLGIFRMKETVQIVEEKIGKDKTRFEDNPNFSCVCTFRLDNDLRI